MDVAPGPLVVVPVQLGVPLTHASCIRLGLLLVMVICSPADAPVTLAVVSRFLPTVTLAGASVGGLTVTATLLPEAGVRKPVGATAVRVVLPMALGLNSVMAAESPPAKVTGETTVPALALELLTFTAVEARLPLTC